MKTRFILMSALFALVLFGCKKETDDLNDNRLKGVVVDKIDKEPIPFAYVGVRKLTSSFLDDIASYEIVDTLQADESGEFYLDDVEGYVEICANDEWYYDNCGYGEVQVDQYTRYVQIPLEARGFVRFTLEDVPPLNPEVRHVILRGNSLTNLTIEGKALQTADSQYEPKVFMGKTYGNVVRQFRYSIIYDDWSQEHHYFELDIPKRDTIDHVIQY